MRPSFVVLGDPGIEVGLQLRDAAVDLLAEGDAVELIRKRRVRTLSWAA
jgi:uncharacterized Zn ribbon protein